MEAIIKAMWSIFRWGACYIEESCTIWCQFVEESAIALEIWKVLRTSWSDKSNN
jgi:hypothetical protein